MAEVIPIRMELPPDEAIGAERGDLVGQSSTLYVTDQESADRAGRIITAIRALRAKVKETFDPIVEAAHKAHKAACDKRSEHDAPLVAAERTLKDRIAQWTATEERKRREEAARLAAEARRRDEEARLAEAAALEQAGEKEAAERVLDEPPPPPPVIAPPPKVAGVRVQQVWHTEVTDLLGLVRAIAEGKAPLNFIVANQSAITQHAKATGGMAVPGVRSWQAPAVAARGR